MTADETASGQPGALECAVTRDRLEGILGARRGKSATRWQRGRNYQLITADERSEEPSGYLQQKHGSPATQHGFAPGKDLGLEHIEAGGVRFPACSDNQIPGRLPALDFSPPDLAQAPPQTIAGHRGGLKLGDNQSHPWLARQVVHPNHIQMLETAAPSMGEATANVRRAYEPMGSRQARRTRQEPPCFDGIETVSCFRPFLRRRESTARPQRVAIRARNPCLLIRRLLRGR